MNLPLIVSSAERVLSFLATRRVFCQSDYVLTNDGFVGCVPHSDNERGQLHLSGDCLTRWND